MLVLSSSWSKSTSTVDIPITVEEEAILEAGVKIPNQIGFCLNYTL